MADGGYTFEPDDDDSSSSAYEFVEDGPTQGASGIAPSTEGIEPVDDRPGWLRALAAKGAETNAKLAPIGQAIVDFLSPERPRETPAEFAARTDYELAVPLQHFADLATPEGMALRGASHLAGPLLSGGGGAGWSGVAQNMGLSAAQNALDAAALDPEHRASSAAIGAATGAAGAGLFGAAGQGARALANTMAAKALRNRVAATGMYGAQLRNLAQNKPAGYVEELGQQIEDKGLHLADPSKSRWNPVNWFPQPAETYAVNAGALRSSAGQRMNAAEQAVGELASPPTVDVNPYASQLEAEAAQARGMWDPAGRAEGAYRQQFADRMRAGAPAVLDEAGAPIASPVGWNDALAQRRYVDKQINWNKPGGYANAGMQEQVRRDVAGNLRSGTKAALDVGVDNGTVPAELRDAWRGANNDYAVAAAVEDPAMARVWQEYGNQKMSLPGMIAASGGLSAGGIPGAVAAGAAGQILKTRGASALSGMQSAASAGLRGAASISDDLGSPAAQRAISALAQSGRQSAAYSSDNANADSRGYMVGDNIERALQQNPQMFGQYAQQFENARGDRDRLIALHDRLMATDNNYAHSVGQMMTGALR